MFWYFHRNRDATFKTEGLPFGNVSCLLFTGPLAWMGSDEPSLMKFQSMQGCCLRIRLASHLTALKFSTLSHCSNST